MTGFDITTQIISRIENLYEEKERQLKSIQNDSHTQLCKTQLAELKIREMWGIAQAIQQIHEYERIYYKKLNNAE